MKKNNMITSLISAFPTEHKDTPVGVPYLNVSEFYANTIQGEGYHIGYPASFLRLQGCPLNCTYCDTTSVWHQGNPYTIQELLDIIYESGLYRKFVHSQHLVITGGSPLIQQASLIIFFREYKELFGTLPFVELENECVIPIRDELSKYVQCWNNSPKLKSSGMGGARYQPSVIKDTASLHNSWFKFVITGIEFNDYMKEWREIMDTYLEPGLIQKKQIILMPMGATKIELEQHKEAVVNLAVTQGVRYCTREHIALWDKKIGV